MKIDPSGFIEYVADGEDWRVDSGRLMLHDFGIAGSDDEVFTAVVRWHEVLSAQPALWRIVCRLFGATTLFGVEDPDLLRPWKMDEIAEKLAVPIKEVEAGFAEAKRLWQRHQRAAVVAEPEGPVIASVDRLDEASLEKLLLEHGFVQVTDPAERRFMAGRIIDLEVVLESENQRSMARSLIDQEANLFFTLQPALRAAQTVIRQRTEGGQLTKDMEERLTKLMESRNKAQAQIEATMKALGLSEAQTSSLRLKRAFKDSLATIVEAVVAYEAHGDRALIDGVFTATEVEILTEEFATRPFQYRPDLIFIVPDCIENLFDPGFSVPKVARAAHRRLLAGFRQGLALARTEAGEAVGELDPESIDRTEAIAESAEKDGDAAVPRSLPPQERAPAPKPPVRSAKLADY
jgi:hypothetical protein